MFLKSVSTSKSRVTFDLDTDRVTYDLDTTTHKIIGVVGSPSLPHYTGIYCPSEISSFTVVEIFTLTIRVLTQTAELFMFCGISLPIAIFYADSKNVTFILRILKYKHIFPEYHIMISPQHISKIKTIKRGALQK